MASPKNEVLAQLDSLIAKGKEICSSFQFSGGGLSIGSSSPLPESTLRAFLASATSAVDRIAGRDSAYYRHLPEAPKTGWYLTSMPDAMEAAHGVLMGLRNDVASGYLDRLEQRIRSNTYDDFLVQAEELLKLKPSYHVAAMVLVGGVLEDHLREMCSGRSIQWKGKDGIDAYNTALKEVAYDKPTWRQIQVVGDRRNAAAHGGNDAANLKPQDVEADHQFVRRFLAEHPA